MENGATIDRLRQLLDSEEASDTLTAIPADTYVRLSGYAQRLRATGSSGDDAPGRLARKQLWLMEAMTRRLLQLRIAKAKEDARAEDVQSPGPAKNLLPEERYLEDMLSQVAKKEERFIKAVVDGQSSFFSLVQRREAQRMTTVRISKRVGEIMGTDLKRYGPFEVNDVARIPAGNAQVMVASNQAVPVSSDEY